MKKLRESSHKDYYCSQAKRLHYMLLYVTKYLIKTNITPNQITIFWLTLQLVASSFMTFGSYFYNVLGILLYTVAGFCDAIDGQVARIKKIFSYRGVFLEQLGVYLGSPIFFISFSIGIARANHNYLYLILGVISALALLWSKLMVLNQDHYSPSLKPKIMELNTSLSMRNKGKKFSFLYLLVRRSNPLNLLFILIIFNLPTVALGFYTILYVLELLRRVYSQWAALSKLDKNRIIINRSS